MTKIVFVCNSSKIHNYIYLCINSLIKSFSDSQISLIIDENCKANSLQFNNFIDYIDHRYSNFILEPLDFVDVTTNNSIKIIENINQVDTCDWIVLQNKDFDFSNYENFSKNGLIALDFDYNNLKKLFFKKRILNLNLNIKKSGNLNWLNFKTILKPEKGLKNNASKILFNYSVFLNYFLKNHLVIDLQNFTQTNNSKKYYLESFKYYTKLTLNLLSRKFTNTKMRWKIAIKQNNTYHFLTQPEKSFWADPFIIQNNDHNYIFFEELKHDSIGAISCLEIDKNFKIINKQIIIDKAYHLSFPNVFKHENNHFMIPESSANNSLDIYKCSNFPYEWHFHKILIDKIRLLDPVLFFHDNIYWIFGNKIEGFEQDNNERLYLYFANDLFSKNWNSHPQNPIINDSSLARNAGKIYQKNNKIYRVSQNCSNSYGKNLVVNQITTLTTQHYVEQKDHEIYPDKKFKGMHTMNFIDDLEVFDFLDNRD